MTFRVETRCSIWLTFRDLELPPNKAETPLGIAMRPVPKRRVKEWQRTCGRVQRSRKSSGYERYRAITRSLNLNLFETIAV